MGIDPTTYDEALERLKGGLSGANYELKVARNTTLSAHFSDRVHWTRSCKEEPTVINLSFHHTDIVRYFPDGKFRLAGIFTPSTRQRIAQFTPFTPFVQGKYGFIGTPGKTRAYRAGMCLRSDGWLLESDHPQVSGEEWMNPIDAMEYFEACGPYTSQLLFRLLHGKLEGWDSTSNYGGDGFLVKCVLEKKYAGEVVVQLMDDGGDLRRYQKLLDTLKPENYRKYWLTPTNEEEETEKYQLELRGFIKEALGTNCRHPHKKHGEFKQEFLHMLFAAFGLEEAQKSGW